MKAGALTSATAADCAEKVQEGLSASHEHPKKSRTTRVVRLPVEVLERIEILAIREKRKLGEQIRFLLEEPLAKAEAQGTEAKATE